LLAYFKGLISQSSDVKMSETIV